MSEVSVERGRKVFGAYLIESGYRPTTVKQKLVVVEDFFSYLAAQGVADLRRVDRASMLAYAAYLRERKHRRSGEAIRERTRLLMWSVTRLFFRSLYESGLILAHPMRDVALVKRNADRVRVPLSEEEVFRFLDGLDTEQPLGLRDRALFELIYSSGLRGGEAARLVVGDVDLENRLVKIRCGKFSKDRVVPVTENAASYLAQLIGTRGAELPLFWGSGRGRLSAQAVNKRFKVLLERAHLYRNGVSVHALRHACATHLLAHGADLRYVQTLLGHQSVQTTVVYTNELYDNLRRRYLRHHPRENELRVWTDEGYRRKLDALVSRLERAARVRCVRAQKQEKTERNTK